MSNLQALSDAQVVLLAAQFISDVNVESLQILAAARTDVLTRELIYRLLLTLYPSNGTARSALIALLRTIRTDFANISHLDSQIDASTVIKLPPSVTNSLVNQLYLPHVKRESHDESNDALADFVIAWSHHQESTDGTLEDVVPLVEDCIPESETLKWWATAYLLPAVRLRYQFYVGEDNPITLQQLESLSGIAGVKSLLKYAERRSTTAEITRDLDEVVSPWIDGTRQSGKPGKASWADVFEWILNTSLNDFELAAKALLDWDGPPSIRTDSSEQNSDDIQAFAQTAFAVIFASNISSERVMQLSNMILRRFASMKGVALPETSISEPDTSGISSLVAEVSDANLLQNALLIEENRLTRVSGGSITFLLGVLKTADVLLHYEIHLTAANITRICLSRSAEQQSREYRRILQQLPRLTSKEPDWCSIRQELLWLRSWNRASNDSLICSEGTFLAALPKDHMERGLLNSMLSVGNYAAARQIYLGSNPPPLDAHTVEQIVVAAVFSAFDNASNGNRTRGGVKRASEILAAFQPAFADSQAFRNIEHLLRATHSLSFYQLTLHHGVPFRPVNIRAHEDPLDLVARVLEQDTKSYTKLDDLLGIGRNLALAHLGKGMEAAHESSSDDTLLLESDRRVTYLAIRAALAAHDFDTAYSYIITRLSKSSLRSEVSGDDFSWRAAYAAGRYRPTHAPKLLHDQISSLSKRMDLLSLSLALAPSAESLSEILGQWRRCEEEMDTLKSRALEEERAFEVRGDDTMPGGFGIQDQERDAAETRQVSANRSLGGSAATYEEAAPLGLFEVARGAATALRKSAFPLNAASVKDLKIRDAQSRQSSGGSVPGSPTLDDGSGRVRKRDMVSNMVTSGLVSGMGWVLGAQPASKAEVEND
jgi:protein transport protein SEC39